MKLEYTKECLLSFREKEECKRLPSDLDPALRRDSSSSDVVDGGSKFVSRRDQELPEWRSRGPSANGGVLLPPRPKDEEGGSRGVWNSRAGSQSRWDRDRERGSGSHWEGSEQDTASRSRFGWNNSEHDGLLGSGGGLRGAYPGGRGTDRYNGGGRGTRNSDSRLNKSGRDTRYIDGETFGEKASTEDRAEEERKRREEFEAMRREQQRLKEQKGKQKEDNANKENNVADSVSDLKHDSTSVAVPTPRPLVPPGFSQRSNIKKEEQISDEQTNKQALENKHQTETVDPLAITCSEGEADSSRTRVIDKLFSNMTITAAVPPSSSPEKADTKTSKFAHLFSVEDENTVLSLVGGNSPQSPVSKISEKKKASSDVGSMLPMPVGPLLEDIEKTLEGEFEKGSSSRSPLSQRLGKPVLTCEDIEQSFLAEAKIEVSVAERIQDASSWKQEAVADKNASRHLLSLLQKPSLRTENDHLVRMEEQAAKGQGGSDNGVSTLESLFGTSFMRELRSTDAPLSAKVVSETHHVSTALRGVPVTPSVVEFQPEKTSKLPDDHHWTPFWNSNPERHRDHATSHMMSLDEVERNFLDKDATKLRQAENGDPGRPMDQSLRHPGADMFDAGAEFSGNRNQPKEEPDGGVLSDFLKFKKAIKHRNRVNDGFLGRGDGMTETLHPDGMEATSGVASISTPAALFRSHSPPAISQRSSPLQQLHQLQQAIASQGGQKTAKQFQHNALMANGEMIGPDGRYVRTPHARPPFPRQQQAMYEQIHGHYMVPQGFPPQQFTSKQRSPGYFPPNGSNQPVSNLHMIHAPPMSYGHPPPPFGPGFPGTFAPPNEVFLGGGEHPASASLDNNNTSISNINNNNNSSRSAGGVPYQAMYGVNKLGYP